LVGLALGFRESTIAVIPAVAVWWLMCRRRDRLRERATYVTFIPFVVVGVAYVLLRTRFFSEPATDGVVWDFGRHLPGQFWYYMKVAALPVSPGATGVGYWTQWLAGVVLLGTLPVLLWLRRWLAVALVVGFLVSVAPYAPLLLGVTPRYLYFPSAFLALAVGHAAWELLVLVQPRLFRSAHAVGVGVFIVMLVLGASVTNVRTRDWVKEGPEVEQAWVDELRSTHPQLEPGATLYCANVPLVLALFENANLQPVVQFFYPNVTAVRFEIADLQSIRERLGPEDRIFIPAASPQR
jgi:hypothetical protein